ncbi:40S ribosomal protein S7-like [Paramacrobiotus metropolitanus]|uniref:40S ribosomal protein S7-like n=1 Tax=Paramacrobiotus metropolitanus TaxID=2943436 RepID=UPI002446047D|nr:40S ribosomal protein S7-like [Paramacrobiotus metropolitanus]
MAEGKFLKQGGEKTTPFESQVSQLLLDLEQNNNDLRNQMQELLVNEAKEMEVGGKNVIVLLVPPPQLKAWQKIHVRVVRELEKKLGGRTVIFIAKRRMLPKPTRKTVKLNQKRPRSRTLTAVHENMLADIVYPAEIVGKRIRIKTDGSRLIKVHLDKASLNHVEHKTDVFASLYKKLTGKAVSFEFPEPIF